jgi:hypothetical protein
LIARFSQAPHAPIVVTAVERGSIPMRAECAELFTGICRAKCGLLSLIRDEFPIFEQN